MERRKHIGTSLPAKFWILRRVSDSDFTRAARLAILTAEILLPLISVYIISNFILGSPWLLELMDRYRPGLGGITTTTHVEKQMLHIEADARLNGAVPKVVFLGTSSVVNGIDVGVIEAVWRKMGFPKRPVNYGLTGLMAYELPFLKEQIIRPENEAIVFLYNTFCFSDIIHPQAASTRFDSYEFFHGSVWRKATFDQFFKGLFGEMLFIIKYRGVIKTLSHRLIRGQLKEMTHWYDFAPGQPQQGNRPRRKEKPARHWLRDAYVTSDTHQDTIGYRGFRRWLDLTESAGIRVIIAAIPVPDFAQNNQYRVDVNHERIDARIEEIAQDRGIPFLGRKQVRFIETDDTLFWDRIHLHDVGRTFYSEWLAKRVLPLLRRS
jgi:hypothetical protein